MKRGTTEHPKFLDLCAALQLPKYAVVGVLETLWHFTAKFSPQGDVGRFSNASIARALEWAGEPDELIAALLECRWLDHHQTARLIVHDWKDHADQTLKRGLAKRSQSFVELELEDASTKLASASSPVPVPDTRYQIPEASSRLRRVPDPPKPAGSPSLRFDEFWGLYPVKDNRPISQGVFSTLVTTQNEKAMFACLRRYLDSDRGARSPKNPSNWLHDCAQDNWESDWPSVKARDSPAKSHATIYKQGDYDAQGNWVEF